MTPDDTRSQPQSRRGSTQAVQLLINPQVGGAGSSSLTDTQIQEISRRASDVSNVPAAVSRRGSVHRGSLSLAVDTEDLEAKKMKAVLQLMGFQKKAQKEFRWDAVTASKPEPENKRR